MNNSFNTYAHYHQNPINKLIHAICIPFIVLTITNFIDEIKITDTCGGKKDRVMFSLKHIFIVCWLINYGVMSFQVMLGMAFYLMALSYISALWKTMDKHWMSHSVYIHIIAWLLQFVGHYIEGRKPALIDSVSTTLFEAPMFSFGYITEFFIKMK